MFRAIADMMCQMMGRPMTLVRDGGTTVSFVGKIVGQRADPLLQSAEQGDMLCVIPAAQVTTLVPKKFDRIIANGRVFTVQFVRECWDGAELAHYKAIIRG